jgi:hypothetical protein
MHQGSCTTNRPWTRWDFHRDIRPGPGHVLGDVSFIQPLTLSYTHRSAQQPCSHARSRDRDNLQEYLRDHNFPGHTFRPISLESSVAKWRMGLSPGRSLPLLAGALSPTSSATWLWCGAAKPLACSRRPLVSKMPIMEPAGSRALIILQLICTADGKPGLGPAAWVTSSFVGPQRWCRCVSEVVACFLRVVRCCGAEFF